MTLQGPRKDFALHTIGWQAFQDMANTIVEVAFGRTVVRLAKFRDQGRDGFFHGLPDVALKANDPRETTIQSKHFEAADRRLKASDVTSEFGKAAALAASGRAHGYILVTNASVVEGERRKITDALRAHGVVAPYVLGREWLVEKILAHVEVRALLPRIYGLGDMSWIKNETALKQARAILTSMGSGLKLYVPTAAHRKAADMLAKQGCVLLLGDPAAGKSSIAAALCIAEVDRRNGDVIYVRDPKDFVESWDPDAADRLFWIDDAFGATRLATGSMDVWNKIFSSMASAKEQGNRFVLTSRSHIWNEARSWLKRTAYEPLLQEQIVVEVENLSLDEKERILYNHIRFGRQPPQFRRKIAPLLDRVLASGHFSPEVARRLGDPSFTSRVLPTIDGLVDFFARPREFLGETLANLPEAQLGAIGLVFLNDGRLRSPLEQDDRLRLVADLYGVTLAQLRCALRDLDGSFLTCIEEGSERTWTYKHPTMADAYRRLVGPDPELVAIYVRGAPVARIFEEATCGVSLDGTIPIPSALYDRILDRLPGCGVSDDVVRRFLLLQSGDDFFVRFLRRWPEMVTRRSRVDVPAAHCDHTLVRVRAAQLGCLPDEGRSTLLDDLQRVLREHADVSFIGESPFDAVLTAGERSVMLDGARHDPANRFDRAFANQRSLFPSHFHTWACYEDLEDQLRRHRTLFPDDQAIQDAADRMLERIERMLNEDALANFASRRFMDEAHRDEPERPGTRRSIFDDLSQEL